MDASSSQILNKCKTQKRPDSLKVELLTIPEDRVALNFEKQENQVNIGFQNLSYSVTEGVFHRSKYFLLFL